MAAESQIQCHGGILMRPPSARLGGSRRGSNGMTSAIAGRSITREIRTMVTEVLFVADLWGGGDDKR